MLSSSVGTVAVFLRVEYAAFSELKENLGTVAGTYSASTWESEWEDHLN